VGASYGAVWILHAPGAALPIDQLIDIKYA